MMRPILSTQQSTNYFLFFVGFLINHDGSSIFEEKVFRFRYYISNAIPAGAHRKQTGVKHAVASKPPIKVYFWSTNEEKWR